MTPQKIPILCQMFFLEFWMFVVFKITWVDERGYDKSLLRFDETWWNRDCNFNPQISSLIFQLIRTNKIYNLKVYENTTP